MPLLFQPNWGQIRGGGFVVFGRRYSWRLESGKVEFVGDENALKLRLLDANESHAEGLDETSGKFNYFLGNDATKWIVGVPTYQKVRYANVYPGIDLVLYGAGDGQCVSVATARQFFV